MTAAPARTPLPTPAPTPSTTSPPTSTDGAGPRVTIRPAPLREPPFDDQVARRHLRLVGPHDRPLPFAAPPTPSRPAAPAVVACDVDGTPLPDAAAWGRRLLVGITESAAGRRPMQQLSALLSPSVAHGLGADLERAAQARRPHWTSAASVRTVRATHPRSAVAEVCATVQVGDRVRAVALRLEAHRGRWRCTRLQWG